MSNALDRLKNRGSAPAQPVQQPVYEEAIPQQQYQEPVRQQAYQQPQQAYQQPAYQEPVYQPQHVEHPRYQEPVQPRYQEPVQQTARPNYQQPIEQEVYHKPADIPQRPIASVEQHQQYRKPQQSVEVYGVKSELTYSAPDAVGLSVLGLNTGDRVTLVKPRALEVTPIVIERITDRTGKVSAKLNRIMHDTGVTVLPLRECGVFEQITDISDFQIISVRGKKFASYCGNNYPVTHREIVVDKIIKRITSCETFGLVDDLNEINSFKLNEEEALLARTVHIHGLEVKVPSLCVSELEYIYAYFISYAPNIVVREDDFGYLIVGTSLEGNLVPRGRGEGGNGYGRQQY